MEIEEMNESMSVKEYKALKTKRCIAILNKIRSSNIPTIEKRNKYNAKKIKKNGITFDSKKEYERYNDLILLQKSGVISNLEVHKRIPLLAAHVLANGILTTKVVGHYEADFVYTMDGDKVYEDTKGFETAMYKFKKKIVDANYGIKIKET